MADTIVAPAPAAAPANAAPGGAAPAADPSKQAAPAAPAPAASSPQPAAEDKKGAAAEPGADNKEKPAAYVEVKKEDLKLPEGSLLDPKSVEEIAAFASANKLSKEAATAILERESKLLSSHVDGEKAKLTQAQNSWTEAARTDKEIGGEKFSENVECAHRVFKNFASEGLMKMLDDTKMGNHPDVIRTFNRIGRAMGILDDKFVIPDGSASGEKKDAATQLYGNTAPKESK